MVCLPSALGYCITFTALLARLLVDVTEAPMKHSSGDMTEPEHAAEAPEESRASQPAGFW